MADEKRGSGLTSKTVMTKLQAMVNTKYEKELQSLGQIKKQRHDDLVAGFADGVRTAIFHLQAMGVIEIVDDTEKRPS